MPQMTFDPEEILDIVKDHVRGLGLDIVEVAYNDVSNGIGFDVEKKKEISNVEGLLYRQSNMNYTDS